MAQAGLIKNQADGKLHYINSTGALLPIRSIVVIGDKVGVINSHLADGQVGIADMVGIWPMPVLSTLTPSAGTVLGWDVADEEWNDDLVNNTIHARVACDSTGALHPAAATEWIPLDG